MIGISILYDISGHLLMSNIKESIVSLVAEGKYRLPIEVVICLFAIGLGIKSALYPFHSWLPDAHGSSTSSSSAVLSGLVLKAYIILLIKLVYRVFSIDVIRGSKVLDILFVLGVLAMTIGSIKAINSRDLKRMIAYSSVAQIGYIYLGIGLGNDAGMIAACFQILVHAFTKPMLFNTAGAFMDEANGSRKFKDLAGAARKNLWAGIGFAVGAFSMIGIPLFAGFVVKYNLALASLDTNRAVIALIALVISTVLNAIYYIPALMVLFKKTDSSSKLVFFADKGDVPFIFSNGVFIISNFILGTMSPLFITLITIGLNKFA
jgi:multicomponent Na+:H+ antiporter subunit D